MLRIDNTAGIYHQKLTNPALLMSHAIICSLLVRVTEASFSRVLGSIKKTSPRDTGLLAALIDLTVVVSPCMPASINVQLPTAKLWKQVLKSPCLLYIPQIRAYLIQGANNELILYKHIIS